MKFPPCIARLSFWMVMALSWVTSGCAVAASSSDSVAVTAVNYTGQELNAVLFLDPESTGKVAGGTGAMPYSGSGAMCCFALPSKWRPGIKVKVRYDWWNGSSANRDYQFITAELPPYPTEEPGVLWALFYDDGSVEVFASAVDPGHPKWPGKVKTWPVPSREYKLSLWQIEYEQFSSLVPGYERMAKGLSQAEVDSKWNYFLNYRKKELAGFSGPSDPKFAEYLRREGLDGLERVKERLQALERNKP
jgi:Protein of unknown function (DUF3304)